MYSISLILHFVNRNGIIAAFFCLNQIKSTAQKRSAVKKFVMLNNKYRVSVVKKLGAEISFARVR